MWLAWLVVCEHSGFWSKVCCEGFQVVYFGSDGLLYIPLGERIQPIVITWWSLPSPLQTSPSWLFLLVLPSPPLLYNALREDPGMLPPRIGALSSPTSHWFNCSGDSILVWKTKAWLCLFWSRWCLELQLLMKIVSNWRSLMSLMPTPRLEIGCLSRSSKERKAVRMELELHCMS